MRIPPLNSRNILNTDRRPVRSEISRPPEGADARGAVGDARVDGIRIRRIRFKEGLSAEIGEGGDGVPGIASVGRLEYSYPLPPACRPQHQAAEGGLVRLSPTRAKKNSIGVVGVYSDRAHPKHRVTSLDGVPVGPQPACVRPPEPAARGADI